MNILKFKEYTLVNENSVPTVLKDVEINKAWGTYSEMISNFRSKHYRFLGTIYCEDKTINRVLPDWFKNTFTEKIREFSKDFRNDRISLFAVPPDSGSTYDEFKEILSKNNIDEVTSCMTKERKKYYVFFNRDEKYFYFMNVNTDSDALDLWIRIRTKGEEFVYNELFSEHERKMEIRRKYEEERIEKEKKEEEKKKYEKLVDKLKKDVEEHPEKYERVENFHSLPYEKAEGVKNNEYIVYKKTLNIGVYDMVTYDVYINNVDFSDGYVFRQTEDKSKPHTYRGE